MSPPIQGSAPAIALLCPRAAPKTRWTGSHCTLVGKWRAAGCLVCYSCVRKCHKLSVISVKRQNRIVSQFWRLESEIKVSAGLVLLRALRKDLVQASLPGLWMAIILSLCPFPSSSLCVCLYLCQVSPFVEGH